MVLNCKKFKNTKIKLINLYKKYSLMDLFKINQFILIFRKFVLHVMSQG